MSSKYKLTDDKDCVFSAHVRSCRRERECEHKTEDAICMSMKKCKYMVLTKKRQCTCLDDMYCKTSKKKCPFYKSSYEYMLMFDYTVKKREV